MTLQQQRRFARKLKSTISRRSQTGNSEIARSLLNREIERYLRSWAVQASTLFEIRSERFSADYAMAEWAKAQTGPVVPYSYRRHRAERPIDWYLKARATTGHRKICILSDQIAMWHRMAKDLIVAQHRPRNHIGDWRGRGRDYQVRQIVNVIEHQGAYVVVADVVKAFPSVNVDAVYELPYLPETLIRRAIDYRFLRFSGGYTGACPWDEEGLMHDELEMAPSGLLEGSPVSNALFSVFLDDLPDHLDDCISAFVYCDNVILIGPNMEQAQNAARSLVRYFSGHRAGPFEVRTEIRAARDGFEHLGYSIYKRTNTADINLSPRAWEKLSAHLEDLERGCADTLLWLKASFGALTAERMTGWTQIILEEEWRRRIDPHQAVRLR